MRRGLRAAVLALGIAAGLGTVLGACSNPRPDAGMSVGSGGAAANAGVRTDAARAGVSTNGAYASADVVKAGPASVTVGTGGVGASVKAGPVRVGVGSGGGRWWRMGLGL